MPGPTGSGKTTLTSDITFFREIPLLDPDAISKSLQSTMPSGFPVASARRVLKSAKEQIAKAESFAVETTLSGKHYLQRADHTILFDNSTEEGYRLVAVLGPSGNQWFEPIPDWALANQR